MSRAILQTIEAETWARYFAPVAARRRVMGRSSAGQDGGLMLRPNWTPPVPAMNSRETAAQVRRFGEPMPRGVNGWDGDPQEILDGLAGARFVYGNRTYMIEDGDIFTLSATDEVGMGRFKLKRVGKLITAPVKAVAKGYKTVAKYTVQKPLQEARRFAKTDAGKIAIGVAAIGAGAYFMAPSIFGGSALTAAKGTVLAAKSAGVLIPQGTFPAVVAAQGGATAAAAAAAAAPAATGFWASVAAALPSAATVTSAVKGAAGFALETAKVAAPLAIMRSQQQAQVQQAREEVQQATEAVNAYKAYQESGGGQGGNYGLNTSMAPSGYPNTIPETMEPGQMPDNTLPDVTKFSPRGASVAPLLLLLGGGILLSALMKRS